MSLAVGAPERFPANLARRLEVLPAPNSLRSRANCAPPSKSAPLPGMLGGGGKALCTKQSASVGGRAYVSCALVSQIVLLSGPVACGCTAARVEALTFGDETFLLAGVHMSASHWHEESMLFQAEVVLSWLLRNTFVVKKAH